MSARTLKPLVAFRTMMSGLRELVERGARPAEILGEVLDQTGYLAELRASDDPQDASRVENLAELHAVAAEFSELEPDGDLADFLERVSLVADSDQIPDEDVSDGAAGETGPGADAGVITLMTLHTAKGLEFPVVFMTGLEDGTFPHIRSMYDDDELSEERRLAYVGITRARERLYLSRSAVRSAWGTPNEFPPSRFLADIPEELWDWRRRESSMESLRGGYGSGGGWHDRGWRGHGREDRGWGDDGWGDDGWDDDMSDAGAGGGGWGHGVRERGWGSTPHPGSSFSSSRGPAGAPGSRDRAVDGSGARLGRSVGDRGRGPAGGAGPSQTPASSRKSPSASRRGPAGTSGPDTGPKFGSATPRADADIPALKVGDRVTHDAYGLGTVVGLEGVGRGAIAKVDFGTDGVKRLLLRFSPVTKL